MTADKTSLTDRYQAAQMILHHISSPLSLYLLVLVWALYLLKLTQPFQLSLRKTCCLTFFIYFVIYLFYHHLKAVSKVTLNSSYCTSLVGHRQDKVILNQ